jgi:trans-2,3-dihydro-3-hydroxyanthranilate isomerase
VSVVPHGLEYVVADVFCDAPLRGNPVALFTDAASLDGDTMQALARELNLSETVFLVGDVPAGADVRARIFTPGTELPFAGHPVLGTAVIVATRTGAETVRIATPSGIVPVAMVRGGERVIGGEMEQPLPTWSPAPDPGALLAALGVPDSLLPIEVYDNGPRHAYVMLADDDAVAAVTPDLGALAALGDLGVSAFCADGTRVHTRMFGPGLGVAEDPATGSAAGPLAVHLARHGVAAYGTVLTIAQGAEIHRPSTLTARADGQGETVTRVAVGGGAVIVAEGRYRAG